MIAVKYFQIMGIQDSNRVMERYKDGALRGLQEAIMHCGSNADAIIAATILMMEAAQNW
jgi:hypothetical protein